MRAWPALVLAMFGGACSHQPGTLRDTTGTIWSWSCGAAACAGTPQTDAGAPSCDYPYGSAGGRLFLLCGGQVEPSGLWDLDPLTCRAAICVRDSDCPDIGGGRIL